MKNRQFVNNNTAILFLFVIGSFLFIELNFRYWYRFLEQYMMFQTTGGYSSLFFNLDLSAGVNRLARDARFRAGSRVFVYFDQD